MEPPGLRHGEECPRFLLRDSTVPAILILMKLTVQLQLLPDADTAPKLQAIVERFNEAANWIAGECFARREANQYRVRTFAYQEVRTRFGLSSQMAQLAIKNVCDVYKRDKSKRPTFRIHAAIVYDQRTMSFKGIDCVSLLTLDGRVLVPIIMGKYQAERFTLAKGQADLVLRQDGKWFLLVTVDVPDGTLIPTTDFIGVDLGIVNLATTSDGETFSGEAIERNRRRYGERRRQLGKASGAKQRQGKRPKAIRRAQRRRRSKETRFRKNTNHVIAKTLVATARRTERGIALEELTYIRNRVTARGHNQRHRLHGWAFGQLRQFITYKAQLAGVLLTFVDPRNTSRACYACGHCEKANRKSQAEFLCRSCGHHANADLNAARNIRARAHVMVPMVAEQHGEPSVA